MRRDDVTPETSESKDQSSKAAPERTKTAQPIKYTAVECSRRKPERGNTNISMWSAPPRVCTR